MADKKIIAVFGATGAQGGGLARAIAADANGPFSARAITRHPNSDKAKALSALGIEVVAGDVDDASTLTAALDGAYGAFCVTNFWEHFSADREGVQATNMARATKAAGVKHVVWSTLEDTRKWIPLDDPRMPTLHGHFKCPHFDSKGAVDAVFANEGAPTTYMMVAFYWDNLIHFGMGPRANEQGELVMALPLGGAKLPGIGAEDIGRCAYGIFTEGTSTIGQRIGIAGESLSGEAMAAKLGAVLGRPVHFFDVPFDTYRALGFPGAEDLGNMFQFQQILGEEFQGYRDPVRSRALYSGLLDFDAWLAKHAASIPIG
ncbi:NmrA/HSCARG family protein [Gemmatimonas sp.]|uniref:NmrA/HSCARG family protein n=1 Tax=Gemmatimonas sp. TaxID=1962908 RepID=UPI0039836AAB